MSGHLDHPSCPHSCLELKGVGQDCCEGIKKLAAPQRGSPFCSSFPIPVIFRAGDSQKELVLCQPLEA